MKKHFLIIIAAVFMAMPLISFGQQETSTNENTDDEKKISYSFINEYGIFAGGTFGISGVFVNGIRFNKTQDLIGIGVGYEFGEWDYIPIFINYRHYFPGKKKLKPLINFAVGTRLTFWTEYIGGGCRDGHCYPYEEKDRVTPGLYATMAAGFKVKTFSFTSGFFLKSWKQDFYGGVEVKVGFTF